MSISSGNLLDLGSHPLPIPNLSQYMKVGRKIIGAGLNYKALLKLKGLPVPEKPTIFLKPSTAYITEGQSIEVSKDFEIIQEVELGVVIGRQCKNVSESEAMQYVGGYCLALDMTNGTLMKEAQAQGLPWCLGKGFDTACPVSQFIPLEKIPNPEDIEIWCKVNGELKQKSRTSDMVFTIPQLISFVSKFMTLDPNDVIITGSPPGMCPVAPGDVIEAGVADIVIMTFPVKSSQ
ncbi:hypothetical protein L9F63_021882 [Diploptera punctata]|uniref:oxaloacetate tautomerase n=1 Tax=Diploptera punctata TaxID=6984 RepID=A0AAD7ZNQ8_DIPPU|nr:hypothetical protein L9F63_021882 [Diploptera punctata]